MIVLIQEFCLEVEDVHAREVKEWADCRISAVRVLSAGVSEFQPIAVSLFHAEVDVDPGNRTSVYGVEAECRPSKFVLRRRQNVGHWLEEYARLTVHR
jgi:hypothetical protein